MMSQKLLAATIDAFRLWSRCCHDYCNNPSARLDWLLNERPLRKVLSDYFNSPTHPPHPQHR